MMAFGVFGTLLLAGGALLLHEGADQKPPESPIQPYISEPLPEFDGSDYEFPSSEVTQMWFEDGTLFVQGGIIMRGSAEFAASLVGEAEVDQVRVFASGGVPESSLLFAQLIQEKAWPIVIEVCLGPCFSYLLPAASRIEVAPGGIYGLGAEPVGIFAYTSAAQENVSVRIAVDRTQGDIQRLYNGSDMSLRLFLETINRLELDTERFANERALFQYPTRFDYWVPSPASLDRFGIELHGDVIQDAADAEARFALYRDQDHISPDASIVFD